MVNSRLSEHLEKLRYFVAVAEEKSIAQAAKRFHLSQPTLSQSIRLLEDVLKTELFHRSSSGVKLTDSGGQLFTFAQNLLREAEQVEHSLKLNGTIEASTMTIGTKEPYAINQWPHYLKLLNTEFPKCELVLRISRTNTELLKLLREETIDLAIIPNPPEEEDLLSFELFKDRQSFYVSRELFEKSSLKEIYRLPLYLFNNAICGNKKSVAQNMKATEEFKAIVHDVDSYNVARSLGLHGLGAALLTQSFADEEVRSGKLVSFEYPYFNSSAFGIFSACLVLLEKNKHHPHLTSIRQTLFKYNSEKRKKISGEESACF